MYFGSAGPLNRDHLRRLKSLVRRTKTPWLTDHLCWGSVDGRYTHDLLPMPYTFEAAAVTARKIREARDFLEGPIAGENVSGSAGFHLSRMTQWGFLNEIVEPGAGGTGVVNSRGVKGGGGGGGMGPPVGPGRYP